MPVSDRVRAAMREGSWIRKMFEEGVVLKQRYGAAAVFDLSLGNPIMEPPPGLDEELRRLANNPLPGMHRYMENAGYPETRAAVAAQLSRETGLDFTFKDIIMTCGAAGALNVVLKTILDPAGEVILFAPYFVEYANYIDNHGGVLRVLPAGAGFMPRPDLLEQAINPRTRAVIINSPNNPTGVVYSQDALRAVAAVLQEKEAALGTEIYLVSDEPYRRIIFDGLEYPSPLLHHARTIVVNSHSKDLALPGERIGYIALHPECPGRDDLLNGFTYCNRTLGYVNAPALMQRLVSKLQDTTVDVGRYQATRDFLYTRLKDLGYSLVRPQGAFYMFPETPVEDDVAFVREMQELKVLVVPGRGFGCPGHFRISYCVDDRTIEGAIPAFAALAKKYDLKKQSA
ncbi:MAG: pyridoxal phosphate-dependent aminotransferase [Chloroflexi bacterium]|nr:pyridoxal phosphate-dependent aminotransferase [Chloroflexota bacterium]